MLKLQPALKLLKVVAAVAAVASKSLNVNLDDIASATSDASKFVDQYLENNSCSPSQADREALLDLGKAPFPSEPLDGEALQAIVERTVKASPATESAGAKAA
jgi:hypothetical protein